MADPNYRTDLPGPYDLSDLREGDRYELSNGHRIYCSPTGGDGARNNGVGFGVLDTDPAVDAAGVDAGYTLGRRHTLLAPDIAVGNVPDKPGWIAGVPPLAVEYAGSGQNEPDLQRKIIQLLDAGTKLVWVVRLLGERRVEVYERGQAMALYRDGTELRAEGILRNPVPVRALFDRSVAHKQTLRNLLQREGYDTIDQILAKGLDEGRKEGLDEGRKAGLDEGRKDTLIRLSERKLGRPLSAPEQASLLQRLQADGFDLVGDRILDLDTSGLTAWLTPD